jgi:hypothetical protein
MSLNTDHVVWLRSGKRSYADLSWNSSALNSCKCPPGVNSARPVTQVQEGDREDQRRKGMSSLQRSDELPALPSPSACIVMNRLVSRKYLGELKVCELAL